ncbi:MAG: RNA-binding protein [Thermoguttaceae bacterium]|nr:RNA-binding protein [Thermoguttaceae bacterium]MDW8036883.1 RNA-binding protein [Thermoguttaceae bacterium]
MTSIYVGNLAYEATEQELREAFEQYGEVSSVTIIVDRATGRPRGFAFVEMPDAGAAAQAIEGLHLARIAGRAVTVNEARPKTQRPRRPGGGRNWSGRRSW